MASSRPTTVLAWPSSSWAASAVPIGRTLPPGASPDGGRGDAVLKRSHYLLTSGLH